MLERKAMRSESRASSRQSLNLTCCQEEEGYYEQTPSVAERSCSSTSSSKRKNFFLKMHNNSIIFRFIWRVECKSYCLH